MDEYRHRRGARALAETLVGAGRGQSLLEALRLQINPAALVAWEADRRRLFHWLPVCAGIGVLLAFAADGVPSPWPATGVAVGIVGLAFWRRQHVAQWATFWAFAALFAGFAAACFAMQRTNHTVLERSAFARISGFVEIVERTATGGRMTITLTKFEALGLSKGPERIRVTFRGSAPRAGDHIQGSARLSPPPQPALPGGYDFARDAWFLELGAVGRWNGAVTLGPQPHALPSFLALQARIDNARTDLTQRIATWIGGQAGALSAALVTGKRGLISEPVNEDLRAAGLYHIVSISGLHMVLAAGVFFWLFRAVLAVLPGVSDRWPVKKLAAALAMLGASAYCIFSGNDVATVRSLIMTLVMLGAIIADRPALSMRNLAIAALVVLMISPQTVLGPSFQMSFAAVAGMVASHEAWTNWRRTKPEVERVAPWGGRLLRMLWVATLASLATTIIASLATAPFAAYHFQRSNPYGLIGNALAIPFVSLVVMPAAVVGTLLLPFGLDGPIWQIMGLGSELVLKVSKAVAALEGAVRGNRAFGVGPLVVITAGFLWLVLLGTRARLLGLVPIVVGFAIAKSAPAQDVFIDREARLVALRQADGQLSMLGKGSSAFVRDRWLAADGGGVARSTGRCDANGCVGRDASGRSIALILQPTAFEEDCARAQIIVTQLQAPAWCKPMVLLMDRERLGFHGSTMLRWVDGKAQLSHARDSHGWKPWFGRGRDAVAPNQPVPIAPIELPDDADRESNDPPSELMKEGE